MVSRPARVEPRVCKGVSRHRTRGAFDQRIYAALTKTTVGEESLQPLQWQNEKLKLQSFILVSKWLNEFLFPANYTGKVTSFLAQVIC